jgi:hypothetical protein
MRQAESLKIRIGIINFVAIQLLVKSTETIAQTNGDNILHIQPVFVSIIVKTYFRYEPFVVKLSRSSSVVLFSFPSSAAKNIFLSTCNHPQIRFLYSPRHTILVNLNKSIPTRNP